MRARLIGLVVFCGGAALGVAWSIRWMWANLPREAMPGGVFCLGILLLCLCVVVDQLEESAARAMRSRWRARSKR